LALPVETMVAPERFSKAWCKGNATKERRSKKRTVLLTTVFLLRAQTIAPRTYHKLPVCQYAHPGDRRWYGLWICWGKKQKNKCLAQRIHAGRNVIEGCVTEEWIPLRATGRSPLKALPWLNGGTPLQPCSAHALQVCASDSLLMAARQWLVSLRKIRPRFSG
jgi:hypothetical protein